MRKLLATTLVLEATALFVFVALTPRAATAATAGAPDAGSHVDTVVVFSDRARVTRMRAARCEQGVASAVFQPLPATLDARTLRGDVAAPAEVIGLGGELVNSEQPPEPRARALEAERQKLQSEMRAQEARKSTLVGELATLGRYGEIFSATASEEMRNPAPNTAAWGKTLDGLRARRATLVEQRRQSEIALRTLGRSDARLARQLQALGAADRRATRTATVTADCHGQTEVTVSLSYVVGGAGWQPEYDLDFTPRAAGKTGPGGVRFTIGAVMHQTTGEDWNNVRLVLSTARPRLGSEAPEPEPLVIGGREQRREKVLVQMQERRETLAAGNAATGAGATAAELDARGNVVTLTLPHRVTVTADGRQVWAPVDVIAATATAKLVATPKLDPHVYQTAVLANPAPYPLLEGRVRSYRAGSYVGDSRLPYRGVGEPMEISLGIDEELKAERKIVDAQDRPPEFLSSTQHLVRAYHLLLSSRARSAETVELRENIPVSQIDEVKVDLIGKLTTPGYQLDSRRGFLTWSVNLPSGERKDVALGYAVALPESWIVR